MNYPYKQKGPQVPEERKGDVIAIRSWLKHQPHLPNISDDFIMQFLHSNYYSIDKSKDTIEKYFIIRAENKELFSNWNFDELEYYFRLYELLPIPKTTPEGYKVLMYKMKDTDPSKISLQALRVFSCFNDIQISEDGLVPGYVVIFDMNGCKISHLTKVARHLKYLRPYMTYIQECHPVRIKGVHIINTLWFADKILQAIKHLIKSEIMHLLHFHSTLDTLRHFVPLELLPKDYGGDSESSSQLNDVHYKMMETEYREWIKGVGDLVADISKRTQEENKHDILEGSFKFLSVD